MMMPFIVLLGFLINKIFAISQSTSFSSNVNNNFNNSGVKFPLQVLGRYIVDRTNTRVPLHCVNWYGAHMSSFVVNGLDAQPLDKIAASIASMGFNCVRLPFSTDLYYLNPNVTDTLVLAANPELVGMQGMDIYDATVKALTRNKLFVILNNHIGKAGWCCSLTDGEGLWYTDTYPESKFIAMWQGLAQRYMHDPYVIGADLRNELRAANGVSPTWGDGSSTTDWRAAAQRAGNAVLAVNPSWLLFVESIDYSTNFVDVRQYPLTFNLPNRLVYSAHDYSWSQSTAITYAQLARTLDQQWGYLVTENQSYTAPLWLGEFGTDSSSDWWQWILQYIRERDLDWAYWSVDGEQYYHTDETFGIFLQDYSTIRSPWKLSDLQNLSSA